MIEFVWGETDLAGQGEEEPLLRQQSDTTELSLDQERKLRKTLRQASL